MKYWSVVRRVMIGVLFVTLFFGGYCLSLTPTTAHAEGGGTLPPIPGDTGITSADRPDGPGDGPSVFWITASAVMSNVL